MKKYFVMLATICMIAMSAVSFTSCGDDDSDVSNTITKEYVIKQVTGTWSASTNVITVTSSTVRIQGENYDQTFDLKVDLEHSHEYNYYLDLYDSGNKVFSISIIIDPDDSTLSYIRFNDWLSIKYDGYYRRY